MTGEAPIPANIRPGWVLQGAVWMALFVLALPLLLLVMTALLAGVIVFGALALLASALQGLRRLWPRSDGRENVRVLPRRET